MYEAVSVLLEIFSSMFQGYCLQYFYGSFLDGRIRNRRINGLAAAALYGALRLGAGTVMPQNNGSFGIFMRLALPAGIMAAVNSVFYRAGGKMRVFLIAVFMAVSEISVFLAYTFGQIGNVLIAIWGWCMEKEYIASASVLSAFVHVTVIGINVLVFMVSAIVMYCLLKGVARAFQEKSYGIGNTELLFLITPSLVGVLVCSLLRAILLTVEEGTPRQIYDRYPSLIAIVPAILILSLLSIVFGARLFQDMIYRNREKSSRIILEKQVSSLQEHMGEMERVYSGIRGMKHDMKNTISVIMQLASGKEELQAYLEELNQTMDRLEFRYKTGNTVVDALLNMKYHEIIRAVPDLRMDAEGLQFPEKLFIQSYDIGIILGNALDNAMEACRKLKAKEPDAEAFMRISSFQKRELFFLKVENSFDGRVVRKPQNEFPVTDKADRENHGIGLANIKSTAEKYQGTMDFKVKGRVFILSVMMKNEKEDRIMAISGIGSNYNNVYEGTYAAQKNEAAKKAETKEAAPAQAGKAKDAGEKAVSDYYSYLQKNYDCMSKGNVTVSSEYLKKCSGDSQKAKELEDFLKRIPELEKQGYEQLSARNKALGGTVTYYQQTWIINKDGSIQSTVYSVTETGMTNAERMKKNMDERLEKQKEKKEEEEKVKEKKEEKAEQAEKLDGDTAKISMQEAAGQEITVKYVEAESESEAKAMMQKEKPEDAYYPKFDMNV